MKCLNFANLNCVIWCQDHWAVSYWSGQASRLHATEADGTVRAPSYDTNRNECDARFGCLWWHMMLFCYKPQQDVVLVPIISWSLKLHACKSRCHPSYGEQPPSESAAQSLLSMGHLGMGHSYPFLLCEVALGWGAFTTTMTVSWANGLLLACLPLLLTWMPFEGRVEVLEVLKAPSYLVLGMLGPSPSHLASVVPGCQERVDRMSSDLRWWQCSQVHHSGYTTRLHNFCQ